ncbi:MAG: ribosomal RNA small subunit methyltransferase A [Bdellovibrionaceae bacterium]|nr:ribosomal RNA small subunit methyltransferase A [Pseudobdellovibrionaceae bacterium]
MSLYADEIRRIKDLMEQLGHGSKRSLGQNFLVNSGKIEAIIKYVQKSGHKNILEIGPGLGALTLRLIEQFPSMQLIELDDQFVEYWKKHTPHVIRADALQLDWSTLKLENALLVSNLPYQIAARIVVDRCIDPQGVTNMVLMFQKEVGQRLLARPSTENYGLLSVMAQTYWEMETLEELGPNDFFPPPKVASRGVTFKHKPSSLALEGRGYLNLIKLAFSHRRKLLRNNISNLCSGETFAHAMLQMKLNEKVRPEELSWEQYVILFEMIKGTSAKV